MKKKIFTAFAFGVAILSNAQSSSFGMKWDQNRLSSGLTFQYQQYLNQKWEVRGGIRVQNIYSRSTPDLTNPISQFPLTPYRDIDYFGLDLGVRRYFTLTTTPRLKPYLDFGVTTFTNSAYDSKLSKINFNGATAYLVSGNGTYQSFRVIDFKLTTGFNYELSKRMSFSYGIGYSVQRLQTLSTDPSYAMPKRTCLSSMTFNGGLTFKLK